VREITVWPGPKEMHVDSEEYEAALRKRLRLLKTWFFLHDRAGCHKGVEKWLAKKNIRGVVNIPARSPDMNPIERMWSVVAKEVSARGPLTEKQLKKFVVAEWKKIPVKTVNKLCSSWPKQLKAVIREKGATVSKT